ncbi:ATP-grasp domain-containing protein [Natronorubrum sp. JWXQ-INN-674]|uniref:ATP-grasp domain-containing protein n=1 Tax=Natronorubrum halalkaliphilum TaxID=2691917 RepID=A0A6B0VPB3_9EURY|nr:ATP-grasp domain-containing protein [Natronorubrum halalkaliphilum]MXV63354.1 ATP-grasp domain-containing protein [Natronorubrum halalkaliphilum]
MSGREPTVLVTGCGAPGAIGTLWSLEQSEELSTVRTIGTDVREEQPGRFACDAFYSVPPADDPNFVDELLAICETEAVDVVLPQVTAELPVFASALDRFADIGTSVAVSDPAALERANSKRQLLEVCSDLGVPTPESIAVESRVGLEDAAAQLGYPERPIVVKPPVANGQRGFRMVSEDWDQKREFYESKPDGTKVTMDRLQSVLGETFPTLLVSEYLPGTEYSVDGFRSETQTVAVPRSRDRIRSGISFQTTVTEAETLIDHSRALADEIGLEYAFGFQFKRAADGMFKILECNPRIQGTMVASTLAGSNLIDAAVRAALGDSPTVESPEWETSFYRYWGGIGVRDGELVGNVGEDV